MCFVWIWEQTAIISLYSINWLVCITETECVYCAVRTGSLYIIQVMCFVWIWEQTAFISLYSINWLVCITETECVYCAVRTGSLYIIQVMCFVWILERAAVISVYCVLHTVYTKLYNFVVIFSVQWAVFLIKKATVRTWKYTYMIRYFLLHVPAADRHLQAVRTVTAIWYQSAVLTSSQPGYDAPLWLYSTVSAAWAGRKSHAVSQWLATAVLQLLDKLLVLLTGMPTPVDISQSLLYFVV